MKKKVLFTFSPFILYYLHIQIRFVICIRIPSRVFIHHSSYHHHLPRHWSQPDDMQVIRGAQIVAQNLIRGQIKTIHTCRIAFAFSKIATTLELAVDWDEVLVLGSFARLKLNVCICINILAD